MAGNGNPLSEVDKEKMMKMTESNVEYKVDMFNALTRTCFKKCIDKRYKEGEPNIGENSCIDRCTSKYSQVTNIIGQMLASGQYRMPPL